MLPQYFDTVVEVCTFSVGLAEESPPIHMSCSYVPFVCPFCTSCLYVPFVCPVCTSRLYICRFVRPVCGTSRSYVPFVLFVRSLCTSCLTSRQYVPIVHHIPLSRLYIPFVRPVCMSRSFPFVQIKSPAGVAMNYLAEQY
jgi:hypothetical protein